MWKRAVSCNGSVIVFLSAASAGMANPPLKSMMKNTLLPSKFLARSLWLSAGVGCALALAPVTTSTLPVASMRTDAASQPPAP